MAYDLQLENGDLRWPPRVIQGLDQLQQRLTIKLQTFVGEWPLDTAAGLPILDWVSGPTRPSVETVGAILRQAILATDGVDFISEWSGSFDATTQTFSFTGRVVALEGEELTIDVERSASPTNRASAVHLKRC